MVKSVFLTDSRRDVLLGDTDHLTDQSLATAKSRIRNRSRLALGELIEVAQSPAIDNEDVFEPEEVYTLISTLLNGSGGLVHGEEVPHPDELRDQYDRYEAVAWEPYEDYVQELYMKIDGGLRERHTDE